MVIRFLLAVTLVGLTPQETSQDKPRVPTDSVEVVAIGCLTGRALKASEARQVDVQRGPDVRSRSFRLAGNKEVTNEIKRQNGHLVEVVGIVKRSTLDDRGMKVGRGIEINGGSPVSKSGIPSAADTVVVMDVLSIRERASSCGGESRN